MTHILPHSGVKISLTTKTTCHKLGTLKSNALFMNMISQEDIIWSIDMPIEEKPN
jgi:hypothetical protein